MHHNWRRWCGAKHWVSPHLKVQRSQQEPVRCILSLTLARHTLPALVLCSSPPARLNMRASTCAPPEIVNNRHRAEDTRAGKAMHPGTSFPLMVTRALEAFANHDFVRVNAHSGQVKNHKLQRVLCSRTRSPKASATTENPGLEGTIAEAPCAASVAPSTASSGLGCTPAKPLQIKHHPCREAPRSHVDHRHVSISIASWSPEIIFTWMPGSLFVPDQAGTGT